MESQIEQLLKDPRLGVRLEDPAGAVRGLSVFLAEWSKWNPRIGLTAETLAVEVLERHVFDSLLYQKALRPGTVVDIGSGGGYPGIPLKIAQASLRLALVESRRKPSAFLRTAIEKLGWKDVPVYTMRAEELPADSPLRGSFDQAVMRAVGPLADCQSAAEAWVRPGGTLVIMKEPGAEAQAPNHPAWQLTQSLPVQTRHSRASQLLVFTRQ